MSGVRILHFLKDWWKFIQIHQIYTMALMQGKEGGGGGGLCPIFNLPKTLKHDNNVIRMHDLYSNVTKALIKNHYIPCISI